MQTANTADVALETISANINMTTKKMLTRSAARSSRASAATSNASSKKSVNTNPEEVTLAAKEESAIQVELSATPSVPHDGPSAAELDASETLEVPCVESESLAEAHPQTDQETAVVAEAHHATEEEHKVEAAATTSLEETVGTESKKSSFSKKRAYSEITKSEVEETV